MHTAGPGGGARVTMHAGEPAIDVGLVSRLAAGQFPRLAPRLPLRVPEPAALGRPGGRVPVPLGDLPVD